MQHDIRLGRSGAHAQNVLCVRVRLALPGAGRFHTSQQHARGPGLASAPSAGRSAGPQVAADYALASRGTRRIIIVVYTLISQKSLSSRADARARDTCRRMLLQSTVPQRANCAERAGVALYGFTRSPGTQSNSEFYASSDVGSFNSKPYTRRGSKYTRGAAARLGRRGFHPALL